MKKHYLICLTVIPLLVGVAAHVLTRQVRGQKPRIEAPPVIDLGLQEKGNLVNVEFTITNTGGRPLELWNFRSGCTCLALERRSDSGSENLQRELLVPGQELQVVARVAIRGQAGGLFQNVIEFQTNDPRRPSAHVEIVARIEGKVVSFPAELYLGTLPRGQPLTQTIEIRDLGRSASCTLARVESNAPEHIRVKALRHQRRPADPDNLALGMTIGEVDIEVVSPHVAGVLDAHLLVFEQGVEQALFTIPVRGTVQPRVQVSPAAIVLPRVTGDGPIYAATCICRSTDGKPLRVVPDLMPPSLTVTFPEKESNASPTRTFVVEWQAARGADRDQPQTLTVRLQVTTDDQVETVTIPVSIRPLE